MLADITHLITALTALFVAVGGVFTAIRLLREVRTGNDKTDAVHRKLESLEGNNALREEERR